MVNERNHQPSSQIGSNYSRLYIPADSLPRGDMGKAIKPPSSYTAPIFYCPNNQTQEKIGYAIFYPMGARGDMFQVKIVSGRYGTIAFPFPTSIVTTVKNNKQCMADAINYSVMTVAFSPGKKTPSHLGALGGVTEISTESGGKGMSFNVFH